MRIFAFFLPQFHTIPENDEWWGKGFTEWTNVKSARPLYKGHLQPKVPLNNNYYNLLDKKTVEWQTQLMHNYKVDGMIYYHYYFKGKMLLEKPAENLLGWKDIKQPFFFCWANHSWYRSWEGSQKILMEQKYGSKEDWEEHFQYLLKFFKDERYEKIDNKPLFMLFKPDFPEKEELMNYFDQRCKDVGFNGLYLIDTCVTQEEYEKKKNHLKKPCEKLFIREPNVSSTKYILSINNMPQRIKLKSQKVIDNLLHTNLRNVPVYPGNGVYQEMINGSYDKKISIRGGFFEWDNTPRHKKRGYIITAPSYKSFKNYICSIKDEDYLFLNAWNEWAEGMILEPTEENHYKYLEWIKKAKEEIL